ncbi:hypothetical protein V6N11_077072 [Hibiscus sabdariffa]|uniref:Uncharacterized protein n=1 Tax=Hibiscus sabdariffa TaxID=183260 RepID=A0ABR2TC02_9ROSI
MYLDYDGICTVIVSHEGKKLHLNLVMFCVEQSLMASPTRKNSETAETSTLELAVSFAMEEGKFPLHYLLHTTSDFDF